MSQKQKLRPPHFINNHRGPEILTRKYRVDSKLGPTTKALIGE